MYGQSFTIGEVISEGWKFTKEHLGFLIGYTIISLVISGLFSAANYDRNSVVLHILSMLVSTFIQMGFYNSALMITAGQKPGFDQLYSNWPHFISWIVANILFGLMLFIGFILLIIPGFYLLARYGLFPFFILEKNAGPIEAFKEASRISEGKRWQLFLLFLACLGLNILGILLLGVGLLFTVPLTLLALTVAYRKLTRDPALITDNSDAQAPLS